MSFGGMVFYGMEICDDQLVEASGCHGRCWEGEAIEHSKVASEIARIVTIGNEPTARDNMDTINGKLHGHVESGPTKERL